MGAQEPGVGPLLFRLSLSLSWKPGAASDAACRAGREPAPRRRRPIRSTRRHRLFTKPLFSSHEGVTKVRKGLDAGAYCDS